MKIRIPVTSVGPAVIAFVMGFGPPLAVAQQSQGTFSGTKQLTSTEGQNCANNQYLTLYLRGNVIGDNHGCSGTMRPDGIFEGSCDLPQRHINYRVKSAGALSP